MKETEKLKVKVYNKLVRDRVPEIISSKDGQPITRKLSKLEFKQELNKKLQEEVAEFLADESMEELADILEVVHGILQSQEKTFDELEKIRLDKKQKRGGFEKQIFLESVWFSNSI